MSNQGFLAITFFETISFSILLVLYLLLERGRPPRFFRFWIAGWAAQTLSACLLMFSLSTPANLSRIVAQEARISGIGLFLAAILEYTGRRVRPLIFWPALAAVWAVLAFVERQPAAHFAEFRWFTVCLQCTLLILSGWLLWRYSQSRPGFGARLLAAALLLAGLHGADAVFWREQPFFLLRVAFQDFFNVSVGIAMAVLVIEARHLRMEDLNEKLRRLTLITAASTQSLNVDQMLGIVLHHLVESLNASHGLVRLITGTGDSAELIIRSAIGYSDLYLIDLEKVSARLPWVQKALGRERAFPDFPGEEGLMKPGNPQSEQLSAALLVRLPGPDAALGWMVVGSKEKRKFYPEEIAFVTNVANLLGLTMQSLRLFEQVATVQRQWENTFDSIDDPILVHDSEGKIIRVNHAFEARSGLGFERLGGRFIRDVLKRGALSWNHC
ncbi:MAG: PAS domain S-box protein, partial [Candidatus Acidiferrales bacterium]